MTDTRQNIKELKEALPRIKEKVIAIAVMLAISFTMIASVSYAWYTMSINPEVKGINTKVSSNGSLEVALAGRYDGNGNLLPPADSSVGDSFSSKDVVEANKTWGNLINLSNYYGIENLVLRPALYDNLYKDEAFLSSKVYAEDGRVEGATTDFGFTQWDIKDQAAGTYAFMYRDSKYYGVRAISSLIFPDGKGELEIKLDQLDEKRENIAGQYTRIYRDPAYVSTIQSVVQLFLSAVVEGELPGGTAVDVNTQDCTEFVADLHIMLDDFQNNVVNPYGDLLAYMAMIQTGVEYSLETLHLINANAVKLPGLAEYKDKLKAPMDYACGLMDDLQVRYDAYIRGDEGSAPILWRDIDPIISTLIKVDSARVTLLGNTRTILEWKNHTSELLSNPLALLGADVPVEITEGAFQTFERLCGAYMDVKFDLKVSALSVPVTLHAQLTTNAESSGQPIFATDKANTRVQGSTVKPSNKVAADTYGMVLDIWVRTNAADSILTLDGLAKYTKKLVPRYIQIVTYDGEGNSSMVSKRVYYYETFPLDENGEPTLVGVENYVYQDVIGENGNEQTVYRDINTRALVYITETVNGQEQKRLLTTADVKEKFDEEIVVEGFNSSNRIDGTYDSVLFEGELSMTQGTGSCYIFYSKNPEEAANTMKMLEKLKLVMVDADNNWLADAVLDTKYAFNDNGKYVIPIRIVKSDCKYTAKDGSGAETEFFGITELEQNEPTLISIIVYLDGEGLENSMVLSGESIAGTLNLQFGSTANLESLFNTELSEKYLSMSALVNGGTHVTYSYTGTAQGATLEANLEGVNANTDVRAVFRRRINATQGSAMAPISLTYNEASGTWIGTPEFTLPGEYVLTGLWIDGVEYRFPSTKNQDGSESPTELIITIEGFAVSSVMMSGDRMAFTANDYVTRTLYVQFNAEGIQPETVSARFLSDDGEFVTALMNWNGTQWTGTATFRSSGTYTLTYLVLDGEYYELADAQKHAVTIYLGLYAEVSLVYPLPEGGNAAAVIDETEGEGENTGTGTDTETETSKLYTKNNLVFIYEGRVSVGVIVNVYTNTGEKMEGLEQLTLIYADQKNPSFPEAGLNAPLTWDGTNYVGNFSVEGASGYYFAYVKVGDSETIAKSIQSPRINAAFPNPPEFVDSDTAELLITGNTFDENQQTTQYPKAIYKATFMYASTHTDNVIAIFRDAEGNEVRVAAHAAGESDLGSKYTVYSFYFPQVTHSDGSSSQNAVWEIVGFEFYDVPGLNGSYHPPITEDDAEPYPVLPSEVKEYTIVQVLKSANAGATLGVDEAGKTTGTFMQEYTFDKLGAITITPSAMGLELDPAWITGITLQLTHNNNSLGYGGYSFNWGDTGYEIRNLGLTDPDGDGVFTVTSGDSIYLAGTYKYKIVIQMCNGTTFTFAGVELLTVKSVKPAAQIASVSPTGSNMATKITYVLEGWLKTPKFSFVAVEGQENKISTDGYTAWLYAKAYQTDGTLKDATFERPKIKIQVFNMGSFDSAEMIVPGGPNSLGQVTFSFSSGTNGLVSEQTIGRVDEHNKWAIGKYGYFLYKYMGYGTITIEEMTIKKGDTTFTVRLDHPLTITNPSSVNQ